MAEVKTCSICGGKYFAKGLCKKHYSKAYEQTRKVQRIAYMKVLRQSPEFKAKQKKYEQKPERKARMKIHQKAWRESPEGKAYMQSPKQKARLKAWRESPEGKAYMQTYEKTRNQKPEFKTYHKNYMKIYWKTPKGKARSVVDRSRRRTTTKMGDLTKEEWLEIQNRSPICPACGKFVGCENLSLDHIIPISKGGKHTKDNVQALCLQCNLKKSAKLPKQV